MRMEHYSARNIRGHDGVGLRVHAWGDAGNPPALFLHGGGQTGWAWEATARRLAAAGYQCFAADLRGHGDSDWAGSDGYDIDSFAADVRCMVEALCDRPPATIGASLGGISALIAEGDDDEGWFHSLVLVDITPRWERAGVARIIDFLTAHPDGFDSLETAAQAVQDYLPHRAGRSSPEGLERNLRQREDGRWDWHWDPAMLAQARVVDQWQPRLVQAARQLDLPTLLISGGRSDVVSVDTIDEFRQLVPHAEHVVIDDAHHMVAGDSNDRFTATIIDYLSGRDARLTA